MFHLFNRVYIEHEKWYSSKYPYALAYKNVGKHPLAGSVDFPFADIPSFEQFIAEKYEGNEELFWEEIVQKKDKFIIYVDSEFYEDIQIRFWKSIFSELNSEAAYTLYKFYQLDKNLKKFLISGRHSANHSEILKKSLSKKEFSQKFEDLAPIKAFEGLNKGCVSFEYLLADFYYDQQSCYASAFKTKLKNLCWKIWFNDMDIFRSEIINSFYDINKVLPELKLSITSDISIEQLIMSEAKVRWILDPDFHEDNVDYVRDTYSPEMFTKLTTAFREKWEGQKEGSGNHSLSTNKVFSESVLEILEDNINKNFGCIFVDEYLRDKANQLLPCFIYEKVRNGQTTELSFLKLRRGNH